MPSRRWLASTESSTASSSASRDLRRRRHAPTSRSAPTTSARRWSQTSTSSVVPDSSARRHRQQRQRRGGRKFGWGSPGGGSVAAGSCWIDLDGQRVATARSIAACCSRVVDASATVVAERRPACPAPAPTGPRRSAAGPGPARLRRQGHPVGPRHLAAHRTATVASRTARRRARAVHHRAEPAEAQHRGGDRTHDRQPTPARRLRASPRCAQRYRGVAWRDGSRSAAASRTSSRQSASRSASSASPAIRRVRRRFVGQRVEELVGAVDLVERRVAPVGGPASEVRHGRAPSPMISAFNRASARCWATRTAPAVLPTASAVSSALMPTTTRRIRISRCFSGRICRSCSSAPPTRCRSPSVRDRPPRTTLRDDLGRLGAVAPCGAVRVSYLVRSDAVHEGQERSSLILVARQRRDGGQAHLLSHVVC